MNDPEAAAAIPAEQVEADREMREMQSYVAQTRAAAKEAMREGDLALIDPAAIRELFVQYKTMAENFHEKYPSDDTFAHCLEQAQTFIDENAF